jgi:integrase
MRKYSAGNIRKRGGYWQAYISYQDEDGQQHQIAKSTGVKCSKDEEAESDEDRPKRGKKLKPTGKGANKALGELDKWRGELVAAEEARTAEAERLNGTGAPATVPEYVEWRIKAKAGAEKIEESTAKHYRAAMPRIRAQFGGMRMADLTAEDVQTWVDLMEQEELAPKTIRKYFSPLRAAVNYAYASGHIDRSKPNPCDGYLVILPKNKRKTKPNPLPLMSVSDAWAKLCRLDDTSTNIGARIMLVTGMRNEEVCALQWRDVVLDDDGGAFLVRHAIGRGKGEYLKEAKTISGVRRVDFGRTLADVLRRWRDESSNDEARIAAGIAFDEDSFVLHSESRIDQCEDEVMRFHFLSVVEFERRFKETAASVGLKGQTGELITPYQLRHTWANMADSLDGVSDKSAQTMMGHSSMMVTKDIYTSRDDASMRKAAQSVDDFIKTKPKSNVHRLKNGTTGE